MIRRLLGWLFSLAMRGVDDTVAEGELHAYLRKQLGKTQHASPVAVNIAYDPLLLEISRAAERLGSFLELPVPAAPQSLDYSMPLEQAEGELALVRRGRISAPAIKQALHRMRVGERFDKVEFDRLLRHIEVRRQASLEFDPPLSGKQRWIAAAQTSLLLVRAARKAGDYRLLNAALKINDWAFRRFWKRRPSEEASWFLLALLETEAGLLEMGS